jgi:hypothetical protein
MNNNMNMNYKIRFVTRALADAETDRYEMVFTSRVVHTEDIVLSIFEFDNYSDNATPGFWTHLSKIKNIKCCKLSSGHGNHYLGGVAQIFGVFDRFVSEHITMKMG